MGGVYRHAKSNKKNRQNIVLSLKVLQKNPPLRQGEDLGGVIEYDFLMAKSSISKVIVRQGPIKKWRRRESTAAGEAEMPLKINISIISATRN